MAKSKKQTKATSRLEDSMQIVKTGWLIPYKAKDDFVNYCKETSTIAQEACAGALFLFQQMPSQIRSEAMLEAKGIGKVDRRFWDAFREGVEALLYEQLRNLSKTNLEN